MEEYIGDLAHRALAIADAKGSLDKECFMYLVRTDERKFQRIRRLMDANEEIKRAKTSSVAEEELAESNRSA